MRLGLTSFGGPIAHVGYFRRTYVERRGWIDEQELSELVAIANLLPGPSSSQLGIAVGARRAGVVGGIAAWLGFTLPSAVAMTAFAVAIGSADVSGAGWVHGLELVAVPVVALAVLSMRRTLAPDPARLVLAAVAAAIAIAWNGFGGQATAIVLGGLVGVLAFGDRVRPLALTKPFRGSTLVAVACLATFALLLVGLGPLADATGSQALELVHAMYRSGALVFGGGHVVLPLLHDAVVAPGWVGEQEFLAGYGLVQAMPGPLFTFSAYLGAIQDPSPNGVAGAALALVADLPSVVPAARGRASAVVVDPEPSNGSGGARRHRRGCRGGARGRALEPRAHDLDRRVGDAVFALGLLALLRVLPVWIVVPIAAGAGALVF